MLVAVAVMVVLLVDQVVVADLILMEQLILAVVEVVELQEGLEW
jgi:hypothetical protein